MDKNESMAERIGFNNGLELAAMMVEQGGALALHGKMAADIRGKKVKIDYPPVEEVMGFQVVRDPTLAPGEFALRPPQADVIRHMTAGPVADTMDHAQLAALGAMIRPKV